MKKILIVILIIMIIIILLVILKINIIETTKNSETVIENPYDYEETYSGKLEKVTSRNEYYMVKNCIEKYNNFINDVYLEEVVAETGNTEIVVSKTVPSYIYQLLAKDYIEYAGITKENILEKLNIMEKERKIAFKEMICLKKNQSIATYFSRIIIDNQSEEVIMVEIDRKNNTFEIYLDDYVKEKFGNIKELSKEKINQINNFDKIDILEYNALKYESIRDEKYVKDIFEEFISQAINYQNTAFEKLDTEYSNAKFKDLEEFNKYISQNKIKYILGSLDYFKKIVDANGDRYICIDNYDNTYIFTEIGVNNYTVMMDEYTKYTPEYLEKYQEFDKKEKAIKNIENVVKALNDKDYKYIYNRLDQTFKNTNFTTVDNLEKYVKENLYEENILEYEEVEEKGEYIVITAKISNNKKETITKEFIVKLLEGTDFAFSFDIE